MQSERRIGIYGGTFSPPHTGHVSAARAFVSQENLDELIVIPTYRPPHKEFSFLATPQERLAMCELAFSGIENTSVSDIEICRQGKSYTYLTLVELQEKYESFRPVLLCGTDMILTLDEWYRFEDIFKIAEIVYIRREKDELISRQIEKKVSEYREKYNATVRELKSNVIDISSTELRLKIKNNESTEGLISPEVAEYIAKGKLYK